MPDENIGMRVRNTGSSLPKKRTGLNRREVPIQRPEKKETSVSEKGPSVSPKSRRGKFPCPSGTKKGSRREVFVRPKRAAGADCMEKTRVSVFRGGSLGCSHERRGGRKKNRRAPVSGRIPRNQLREEREADLVLRFTAKKARPLLYLVLTTRRIKRGGKRGMVPRLERGIGRKMKGEGN